MLVIQNLTYTITENDKEIKILDNINLQLDNNTTLIITGPNGSGKSTLAKIIMGILSPTSGKIFYNGVDITNMSIVERAKMGIAYAFQQPVRFKGLDTKTLMSTALNNNANINNSCDVLSKVGLCARDYLDRELDNRLSGGELKRIEIASVLARDASLNIFDEPEAGIDIWSFGGLIEIFKNATRPNKINIIISHQERLFDVANLMLYMRGGKIVEMGAKEDVLPLIKSNAVCKKLSKEDK
jgi:Fe-S cluster assembly ATP-binding protein